MIKFDPVKDSRLPYNIKCRNNANIFFFIFNDSRFLIRVIHTYVLKWLQRYSFQVLSHDNHYFNNFSKETYLKSIVNSSSVQFQDG